MKFADLIQLVSLAPESSPYNINVYSIPLVGLPADVSEPYSARTAPLSTQHSSVVGDNVTADATPVPITIGGTYGDATAANGSTLRQGSVIKAATRVLNEPAQ